MMRRLAWLVLALSLAGSGRAGAQEKQDTATYHNPAVQGVMSSMIPGLGQFANGQPVKGLAVLGSTVGLLAIGTSAQDKADEDFATCVARNARGVICEEDVGGLPFFWAAGGVWLFGILDAAFTAEHKNDVARARVQAARAADGRVALALRITTR